MQVPQTGKADSLNVEHDKQSLAERMTRAMFEAARPVCGVILAVICPYPTGCKSLRSVPSGPRQRDSSSGSRTRLP
jgi:hypothetical protein